MLRQFEFNLCCRVEAYSRAIATSREIPPCSGNTLYSPLIAGLLMVAVFLPAGLNKVIGFEGTVGYIASVGLIALAVAGAWSPDARRGGA